jgi:2-polyprenyl-3-methyl-5-hydroxy-6-metoxy-1,4-benzoquinol methylase
MSTDQEVAPSSVEEEAGALAGRLFEAALAVLEFPTIWLGTKLGLYAAVTEPGNAAEVAARSGVRERYAREWLEQQAIAGLITVEDAAAPPAERRYVLSDAQRLVLHDDSPFNLGALAYFSGGLGESLPHVLDAWRTGSGLSYAAYGDDFRTGQGLFNKGDYHGSLTTSWLPSVPELEAALGRDGARALDVGCGVGWSSIALAKAYPGLSVLGIDSDESSVMDARANAASAGVSDRVRFEVRAAQEGAPGEFDAAFFFECLHDLGHPVPALTAVRSTLREGGVVFVMEEGAAEEFAPDGSPVERILAASSVLHCLPVGLSEDGAEGTGALLRPATLAAFAEQAGYASSEVLPIEHDMMRFYLLRS